MLVSHASPLPSMPVDVLASTSGDVTVRWTQAPGHHPRAIPADERARIDALAEAVRTAESQRPCDPVAIARTRQELGRALYAMLDGPERALTRRCQDAAGRDGAAALEGDLPGARQRLERSLSITTKLYGTDEHPSVAASLHVLATVLRDEGDPQGAIELLRRVLKIEAKCYGTLDQYHSAETEVILGSLLLQEGAVEEGLSYLVHAARVFRADAPSHPMLAGVVQLLGSWGGAEQ